MQPSHAYLTDSGEGETVRCWDRGTLRRATVDDRTGFLHVDASVTRAPAVFAYVRPGGEVVRALRLPSDVFSKTNLDSIAKATVTNDHPPEMVTTENVRKFSVGTGDGNVRVERDHALVGLIVNGADTIRDMKAGKVETSLGYTCRWEPSSGEFNGQSYDVIQRDHVTNHIAIVAQGRAGSTVRAHMDSTDAIQIEDTEPPMPPNAEPVIAALDAVGLKVGGLEFQLPAHTATAIKTAFDQLEGKTDAAEARAKKAEDALGKATTEIKDLKEKAEKATVDTKELQALADERIRLLVTADKLGVKAEDAQALDNAGIRRAVVAKVLDKDVKDKSDDYINVAFDMAAKAAADKKVDDDDDSKKTQDDALALALLGGGKSKKKDEPITIETINTACNDAITKGDDAWKVAE